MDYRQIKEYGRDFDSPPKPKFSHQIPLKSRNALRLGMKGATTGHKSGTRRPQTGLGVRKPASALKTRKSTIHPDPRALVRKSET